MIRTNRKDAPNETGRIAAAMKALCSNGDEKLRKELPAFIQNLQRDFPQVDLSRLADRYQAMSRQQMTAEEGLSLLTRAAAELTYKEEPQ